MSNDQTQPQGAASNDDETNGGVMPVFDDGEDDPDFADEHDTVTVGEDPVDEPAEPDSRR